MEKWKVVSFWGPVSATRGAFVYREFGVSRRDGRGERQVVEGDWTSAELAGSRGRRPTWAGRLWWAVSGLRRGRHDRNERVGRPPRLRDRPRSQRRWRQLCPGQCKEPEPTPTRAVAAAAAAPEPECPVVVVVVAAALVVVVVVVGTGVATSVVGALRVGPGVGAGGSGPVQGQGHAGRRGRALATAAAAGGGVGTESTAATSVVEGPRLCRGALVYVCVACRPRRSGPARPAPTRLPPSTPGFPGVAPPPAPAARARAHAPTHARPRVCHQRPQAPRPPLEDCTWHLARLWADATGPAAFEIKRGKRKAGAAAPTSG